MFLSMPWQKFQRKIILENKFEQLIQFYNFEPFSQYNFVVLNFFCFEKALAGLVVFASDWLFLRH